VGGIAQLVERLVRNEKVRGSNPLTSTIIIVLVVIVVVIDPRRAAPQFEMQLAVDPKRASFTRRKREPSTSSRTRTIAKEGEK
jgi:hypothetical protein